VKILRSRVGALQLTGIDACDGCVDVWDKVSTSECNGVEHENELRFFQHPPGLMIEQKLLFFNSKTIASLVSIDTWMSAHGGTSCDSEDNHHLTSSHSNNMHMILSHYFLVKIVNLFLQRACS